MEHLVLLDGNHLMHRAYWAIPRTLQAPGLGPVNAVFGVASMLLAILREEQPDCLLFCFDAGGETFRHKEHHAYKEGRAETPQTFYDQIPLVFELIDAFSLQHVADPQYEADDFLCAYACVGEGAGMRVSIVSGDRDILQLATEHVRIIVPHKGYQNPEVFGPREIEEKFGVRPDQVPAWKGLMGDVSDNLPGVRGIGPKTAGRLLRAYGTLEELFAHLDAFAPPLRQKLQEGKEQAFFCQRMARLVCDMPLPVPLAALLLQHLPAERIVACFHRFAFTLLLRRFQEFLCTSYGQRVFAGLRDNEGIKGQLSLFGD